jgi:hypothetical protein
MNWQLKKESLADSALKPQREHGVLLNSALSLSDYQSRQQR